MTDHGRPPLPARAAAALRRLPPGTAQLGQRYLQRAHDRLGQSPGPAANRCLETVEEHLVRPLLLVEDWPDPTDPLPVVGGAVHADLIDDDREAFARLRETVGQDLTSEQLAVEAQLWRLPVTPYRPPRSRPSKPQSFPADAVTSPELPRDQGPSSKPLADCVVIDLSALWAGPLATKLLADNGARVIKVDPGARPDAFAEHPFLYQHLNGHKDVIDLDLRRDDDRRSFESLVADADLVVDSFSRRVMTNLGYGPSHLRALAPDVATLSIVAFPATAPEADWLSYGPGVHATSGLAQIPESPGRYRPAPIAYPDALAGMLAFAVAADVTTKPGPVEHVEVSLAEAIEPLVGSDAHPAVSS